MKANTFAAVPAWTYEGTTPSVFTFFEAVALAGLEEQPIRLDAATQRALLGFPVFGRRSITVHKTGTVSSVVPVAFGQDFEASTYPAALVSQAAQAKKELRPGTSGPRYFRAAQQ
ncbi:hypothetical protein [Rhodoferax sp.]|uniref:hypothetical protein n=1 Tax=Rhodoferax sp. TaxID=50421 RepID=UPI0026163F39|nr:hypothetical protein [Rhodoferax sp.]MDD2811249.1 hypothetical protein [Rhodoferax sp.]MDD4942224.1 hypothetical protein [Rhodoferax sp.]